MAVINTIKLFAIIILMATWQIQDSSQAKILAINFISSKSHFIVYSPLLYGLADRGHQVTIFTPDPQGDPRTNVRHVQIYDTKSMAANSLQNLYTVNEKNNKGIWKYLNCNFWRFLPYVETGCRRGFEHPFTQQILKEDWDLVILTPLYNECLYGFVHQLKAPVVLFNQVSVLPWHAASFGAPALPSFNPLLYYGFSDVMTFWDRVVNFFGFLYFEAVLKFYYNPAMEALYWEYVNETIPSLKEIEKNFSLILANSHISFVPPKASMPDIVDIGGLHLRPAKPLPKDLNDYCDSSGSDGFILFSMGSFLQGSAMPGKYRQIFVNTFAKLKQKVIWKWETESMESLPVNVKLVIWLPQQDVLGHKNIRMFITHGGHGGVTEGLHAGVPLIGIPMFSDQFWNMEQATRKGFALAVTFAELSEEKLLEAINSILSNSSFRENADLLSRIYKDNINSPLERGIYWVEYVLRYGGATHLRSASRDLNFFQYYSLDVISFLVLVVSALVCFNVILIKAVFKKIVAKKCNMPIATMPKKQD